MGIVPQLVVNSLLASSIYALLALGFSLTFNTAKFFNLSHGATAILSSYIAYALFSYLGLPFWLTVILSIAAAGGFSVLSEIFIFRRLRARKATSMVFMIASLGLATALQAVLAMLFTSQFSSISKFFPVQKTYEIYGAGITFLQICTVLTAILVTIVLWFVFKKTIFGKQVLAVSDDEEISKIVGINTQRVIAKTFFIAGSTAALAGLLTAFDTGMDPVAGLPLLLKAIVATIIGGVHNIFAGVLGAVLLGFSENFGIWKISGEWKDTIAFSILILFLIFRPKGIIKS
ncbi:MAG TPA: branched-chain amino acid ABC transporter permease [Patescibacteria group bacterium]|nr:branched-chain amino acid ABC transporter permease [Patescibacteria group bacterium]